MYCLAIVDDNETWRFVLALRLQQQGYTVSTFSDGYALLQEAEQFDLVLVDVLISAPRYQQAVDGPDLICQIKQRCSNPPLLVLISSFFTNDLLQNTTDLCPQADAILSKQSETTEILSQIQQLLISGKSPRENGYSVCPSANAGLPLHASC